MPLLVEVEGPSPLLSPFAFDASWRTGSAPPLGSFSQSQPAPSSTQSTVRTPRLSQGCKIERIRDCISSAVKTASHVKRAAYRDTRRIARLTVCRQSKSGWEMVSWTGSMLISQNSWSGWDEAGGPPLEYPNQSMISSVRIAGLEIWENASWSAVTIPCHESIGLASIHNVSACRRRQ